MARGLGWPLERGRERESCECLNACSEALFLFFFFFYPKDYMKCKYASSVKATWY